MDVKKRVYEDFEPSTEWARDAALDTLLVYLAGFKKEQLKVQITTSGSLRLSGECPIGENKWSRFHKEIPIPSNIDTNDVSAKFEGGILYIKHPKIKTQAQPQEKVKPLAETPKPQMTTGQPPQAQKSGQKQAIQEVPPMTTTDKQTSKKTDGTTNDNKDFKKPTKEPQAQKSGQEQVIQEATPKATMDKQKSDKAIGAMANANNDNQKIPEKKETSDTNGKTSGITDANSVSQKTMEKQKSERLAEAGNVTNMMSEKHENLDSSVNNDAKTDKRETGNVNRNGKSILDQYKKVVGGLAVELKQPKTLMNLVVAILLLVVIGLYAKNAIRSNGKSKN